MTWENAFPLPDYDGGPADRLRDAAAREKAKQKASAPEDFEYCSQWYEDEYYHRWHGDNWEPLDQARAAINNLKLGMPPDTMYRVIRRRKPGPISVVKDGDAW